MRKTAVIIDDEPHIRALLEIILSGLNINVLAQAGDGESGVAIIEKCHPDFVLLDINMPKLNGLAVTSKIRSQMPDVKIIILSAINNKAQVEEIADCGADYYIIKDNTPEQIHQLLKRFIESHNLARD